MKRYFLNRKIYPKNIEIISKIGKNEIALFFKTKAYLVFAKEIQILKTFLNSNSWIEKQDLKTDLEENKNVIWFSNFCLVMFPWRK